MVQSPKSVTHGTCALGGNHPPESEYRRECPVLRRAARAKERADAAKK